MKRSIQRLYWLGVSVTILVTVISMAAMVYLRVEDAKEDLHVLLETASAWTAESHEALQTQAELIAQISPGARVTFLMPNGLVLADSSVDASALALHADRPEVIDVLQGRTGVSLRLSDTNHVFELYMASRLSDSLILRISFPVEEITRMIGGYGTALVLLFALLFLLQRVVLGRYCSALIRQMEDVRLLLAGDTGRSKAVFPELQPEVSSIAYMAERLRENVQEVNRTLSLRNDFVANASHEIRSPLTSIMGFAEMLDEGMADTPEEREVCIKAIRSECERMLDVVEDILLLSRAERQKNVEVTDVDLSTLTDEILQALSLQAAEKGITLRREGDLRLSAVEKDCWEIIYNLVDNAIRYGKPGGHVWVRLQEDGITVEDDGIGIAPEHLPRIFEQFYRVDEARDATSRGTGLGLSIVRAMVERNGAQIHAESVPGEGSRFIIRVKEKEAQP